MVATPIVVEGKNEENMDMDLGTGGTRSQQSDTSKNELPDGPPPMPSSWSMDPTMGTQGVLPSQSEQLSTLAVPTPTDGQGSTLQAFTAPSLSMNATSTFSLNFVASTIRPTLTVQADAVAMNEAMTIQPASTAVPGLLADSFAQDEIAALPGVNQDDPSLGTVPGRNQVLTFVTVTRTAEAKEDIQPSTQTIMAPQAVTTRQSVSSGLRTLSLASGSAIPSSLATAVSVEPQHGLTPLARTLFILFGVLGFVTILLAIGVTLIMRSNRRRAQAARQQAAGSPIKDIEEYDGYGNITRVSANSSIKNFLTEPEKAIVNRAATPDGEPDASTRPSNTLTEAINSFITKSRRLTYKISP
ncbi:hypothetical protein J4E83_007284 [Alternaria metachromatica]|uniref:uncharacterized protein n=1 Tax=Alternaria metachromatica TaxID=283354 RepID=UPI0020C39212|nr:uncharacterized protein J4E83_007284 [Alternaria metachromatica]KAI4613683.1 hypothetical protein J4E83_007284 [Alternaria metachromatica]